MTVALHGKVAVVTGASRGIGRAIAVMLGELGATVVLGCRQESAEAFAAREEVLDAGAAAAHVAAADLTDPTAAGRMVAAAAKEHGALHILVNNAAVQRSGMAHRLSDEDWLEVISVNLSAVYFAARAALVVMRQQGSGHIVNVASASSYVAHPGACSYIAAKHGLIGLTKALALENARAGVLVNAIAPGLTRTDMAGDLDDAQLHGLLERVPLGRMAEPREHASMVRWLLTEARYCTGNVFHVSGGVTMG